MPFTGPRKLSYMLVGNFHILEAKWTRFWWEIAYFWASRLPEEGYPQRILHIFEVHLTKFCRSSWWLSKQLNLIQIYKTQGHTRYGWHWQEAEVVHSRSISLVQALDIGATRTKSAWEIHWQTTAKELEWLTPNGTSINYALSLVSFAAAKTVLPNLTGKNIMEIYWLYPSYFVIMCNKKTMYIGKFLDIYKKGNNSKHRSHEFATSASLSFMGVHVYLPLHLGNVCVYWCP